jgi:hypothetical protein
MNPNALILSPTGRPVYKVGENAWRQFHAGDYSVSIEWYIDGRSCEPLMAIWSRHGGRSAGVFGLCLSSASKYADPSGRPTREAFIEARRALPTLGRAQLDIEVYKLLDVILRHIPDLLICPPAPIAVRRAEVAEPLLEMTVKDENGKVIREDTI